MCSPYTWEWRHNALVTKCIKSRCHMSFFCTIDMTISVTVQHTEFVSNFVFSPSRPINYLSMNWYRRSGTERTPIEQDYTKYLFSLFRRRLTIKIPDTSDSGVYECEVELNRPGATYPTDTATANLTVLGKWTYSFSQLLLTTGHITWFHFNPSMD